MATPMKPSRPLTSPYGIPVSCIFYGHDVTTRDYKDANKIKALDMHPVFPWVATADEVGNVCIWDYAAEAVVLEFAAESVKDTQRGLAEALETHAAFAASQGVLVPDVAGPGLGSGIGSPPGAAIAGGTESFISTVVSNGRRRPVSALIPEDARSSRTGHVRSVRFMDEHVVGGVITAARAEPPTLPTGACEDVDALPLAATIDEVLADMSPAFSSAGGRTGDSSTSGARGGAHAPQQWLVVLCEHRVLLLDYVTRAIVDVPHAALLMEASGPSGMGRTLSRGRPAVHSCVALGPAVFAFGCEDGVIRVWSADMNVVIQTVRLPSGSTRPITHLHVCAAPSSAPGVDGRVLLVSGCADGVVNVWEIMAGRQIADNGRGGAQMLRLPGDLVDLTVCAHTQQVTALASDKSIVMWDVAARPPPGMSASPTAGAPWTASSRVVTSSTASETGVGSKMLSAVSLGAHPFFPPNAALTTSKGPHLELCIAGASDKGSDSGIIFYDLRTARPNLPSKCKVYVLSPHPCRPDTIACGTNIGVFVIQVAPHYSAGACAVTHPRWCAPLPPSVSEGGAPSAQERFVTVYVAVNGALVAADTVVTNTVVEDAAEDAGIARTRSGAIRLDRIGGVSASYDATSVGGGGGDGASVPSRHESVSLTRQSTASAAVRNGGSNGTSDVVPLSAMARERTLVPTFLPPISMPAATTGASGAGNPNAMAALAAIFKPGSPAVAAGISPGTRGVRLRVSASGKYLAAVWPEYRCYAIYRLAIVNDDGGLLDAASWSADIVDGAGGLDVAWCGPGGVDTSADVFPPAAADASASMSDASAAATAPPDVDARRFDRFAVIEPGIPVSVKPVYGGGMAIGTVPPAKGSKKAAAAAPALPSFPNTMKLSQVEIVSSTAAAPKASVVLAEVPLPQEPLAVWSGPVLAVALASDTGTTATNITAALAAASLQFFHWNVYTPERLPDPEGTDSASAMSYPAKKAKEKAERPRLPVMGATSSTPAPSAYAAVNGCGVVWNAAGTRFAVCGPAFIHMYAAVHMPFASTATNGAKKSVGMRGEQASVVELGRVRVTAACASWLDSVLFVTTVDGRVALLCPPIVDTSTREGLALFASRRSRRVVDVVDVDLLDGGVQLPRFPAGVYTPVLPYADVGVLGTHGCVPLCVLQGALMTAHWTGSRAEQPAAVIAATSGVSIVIQHLLHPSVRALLAACTGSSASTDAVDAYMASCAHAAGWAAGLPQHAQDGLAPLLHRVGAATAALMLPSLSPATGIPIALSQRAEMQAKMIASHACVDVPVSVSYLRRMILECPEDDLIHLALTPSLHTLSTSAAIASHDIGVWATVAAYIALSSAVLPEEGAENNRVLRELVARCNGIELMHDAVLVASVIPSVDRMDAHVLTPSKDALTSAELVMQLLQQQSARIVPRTSW